jgi:hypothetical protein
MASLHKEILIEARSEAVWSAIRDFGAVHKRVAPGFVTDSKLNGDVRTVTFANGLTAHERLIDIDDQQRRLVYSVIEGRPTHYNASVQIFPEGENRTRLVWLIDLLPHELAGPVGGMMDMGLGVMKQALARA